ncbi:hypothetical protein HYC85_032268 [Camellia sinensis]|uniref:Pectinesterase inhibitor domain-containing protein n=1 Tax=Camellia sinensis TaxID=4442 RepID=A0A7J7FST1_CAMSI|nr:hypothetical protein HYC85_032268 [Camellia sinensis]
MNSISGFFFLLPLTICLSLVAAQRTTTLAVAQTNGTATATTTSPASLITKACGASQRKDFCVALLNADPNSQKADLKGLAFVALKAASKNATDISAQIKLLLNGTDVAPTVDDGLTNCDKAYHDVVDQIEDSISALVSNTHKDVENWMKAAIADIDTCEMGVKGQTELAVELSRKNRVLRQLCNTALGIVHVVARN